MSNLAFDRGTNAERELAKWLVERGNAMWAHRLTKGPVDVIALFLHGKTRLYEVKTGKARIGSAQRETLLRIYVATGVAIYEARPKPGTNYREWIFIPIQSRSEHE